MPHQTAATSTTNRNSMGLLQEPRWVVDLDALVQRSRLSRCLAEAALLRHRGCSDRLAARVLGIPLATFRGRIRRLYREHGINGALQLVLFVERTLTGTRPEFESSVEST